MKLCLDCYNEITYGIPESECRKEHSLVLPELCECPCHEIYGC